MTRIELVFHTRGFELDRSGQIPPETLLRYAEALRWHSLKGRSLGLEQLFSGGRYMVVVAQKLKVLAELGPNVGLRARLSIVRVGRTSMDLLHELDRVEPAGEAGRVEPAGEAGAAGSRSRTEEQAVARVLVTAVSLDGSGRPTPLPPEFQERVASGVELSVPPPSCDPAPTDAWAWHLRVRHSDLDFLQHVNHAVYLAYIDDARLAAASAGAYGDALAPLARGRVRRAALDYLQQAVWPEELSVLTWVLDGPGVEVPAKDSDKTLGLGFEVRRLADGQVLCRARVEVGRPGRPAWSFSPLAAATS